MSLANNISSVVDGMSKKQIRDRRRSLRQAGITG